MSGMDRITIRHTGPGGVYGQPIHADDLRWDLEEAVKCAIIEDPGADAGEVEVGGQRYRWAKA